MNKGTIAAIFFSFLAGAIFADATGPTVHPTIIHQHHYYGEGYEEDCLPPDDPEYDEACDGGPIK